MTRLLWVLISVPSTLVLFGLSFAAFVFGGGDRVAFFQSPARVGAIVVSLALSAVVVFSDFGGMNPGKKEDRGNRWTAAGRRHVRRLARPDERGRSVAGKRIRRGIRVVPPPHLEAGAVGLLSVEAAKRPAATSPSDSCSYP
jgi:hypothetical protein